MSSGKRTRTKPTVGTRPRRTRQRIAAQASCRARPASKPPARATSDAEVADFVRRMKELGPRVGTGNGRLLFAMDATMSRQPTWDMALALQADMFHAVKAVGGLDVQLVYFRGAGECRASKWVSDPDALAALMTRGHLRRRLHADRQGAEPRAQGSRRQAASMRWSMSATAWRRTSTTCAGAPASWRCCGVPVFLFQEGATRAPSAPSARSPASRKGAYCRFDAGSAAQLRDLLVGRGRLCRRRRARRWRR